MIGLPDHLVRNPEPYSLRTASYSRRPEVITPTFANSGSPTTVNRDRRPPGMTVLPPQYSALSVAALPAYPNAAELDIASGPDRRSSYARRSFEFNTAPNSPGGTASWVSLKLSSNAPKTAQRPRYIGGEKVEGTVILDCTEKRAQVVHSVVVIVSCFLVDTEYMILTFLVQLRGRVVTSSLTEGSQVFLEHVHPVWKNDAVPQSPTAIASPPALAGGKLSGRVELPFDFVFPTEFSAGGKDSNSRSTSSQQHSTPQTLMERGVSATVLYEITLKVISGAFFRSTQKYVIFHSFRIFSSRILRLKDCRERSLRPCPQAAAAARRTSKCLSNRVVLAKSATIRRRVVCVGTDQITPLSA